MLEANPRASRTVPFASKATGVNLVEAACRLAAGTPLAELDLPPERPPRAGERQGRRAPFARFPGADPVLGPEMRSTGEVMASAPTSRPRSRRRSAPPAGRCRRSGTAFLSVRDADKPALVPIAAALAGLGFELVATGGTAGRCAARARRRGRRKVTEKGDGRVVDLIRRGRCDLVVNTPQGGRARRTATRSARRRSSRAIPCITTLAGRAAAVHAIATRAARRAVAAGADRRARGANARSARRRHEAVGPYTLLRVERGGLDPGVPGQFFMLEAPGRLLPRPMSLCLAPPGELAFLIDPIGPGTRALCALERGDEIDVLGPLGNGFRLDVERPLLVGGGIGIAPLPYLSEALGCPPAVLGFRTDWHAEAAALLPNAEVVDRPDARHRADSRRARRARLRPRADAPRGRRAAPAPSSPGRRRWPAATAPVTAARSRSTAS